jgi:hypothetical protein
MGTGAVHNPVPQKKVHPRSFGRQEEPSPRWRAISRRCISDVPE